MLKRDMKNLNIPLHRQHEPIQTHATNTLKILPQGSPQHLQLKLQESDKKRTRTTQIQ